MNLEKKAKAANDVAQVLHLLRRAGVVLREYANHADAVKADPLAMAFAQQEFTPEQLQTLNQSISQARTMADQIKAFLAAMGDE